jgi:hypothetical protein
VLGSERGAPGNRRPYRKRVGRVRPPPCKEPRGLGLLAGAASASSALPATALNLSERFTCLSAHPAPAPHIASAPTLRPIHSIESINPSVRVPSARRTPAPSRTPPASPGCSRSKACLVKRSICTAILSTSVTPLASRASRHAWRLDCLVPIQSLHARRSNRRPVAHRWVERVRSKWTSYDRHSGDKAIQTVE